MNSEEKRLGRLRQRFPFLFLDRVLEIEPGKRCRALKNVSINEKFFTGHFEDEPLLPGVLLIEMMAQAAALVADEREDRRPGVLAKVQGVKFLRTTSPGDRLIIEAELIGEFGALRKFKAKVSCEGSTVASGTLVVADRRDKR